MLGRTALIRAALELAEHRSLDALTLRQVAQHARVSPAAPYHHFENKEALLRAVAEEGFQELARRLALADVSEPANTRVAALGMAYFRFALDCPAHFRVMFRVRTLKEAEVGGAFALLREAVKELMVEQSLSSGLRERTLAAWSAVHGFSVLALDGPLRTVDRATAEHLAEQVIAFAVLGVASRAESFSSRTGVTNSDDHPGSGE